MEAARHASQLKSCTVSPHTGRRLCGLIWRRSVPDAKGLTSHIAAGFGLSERGDDDVFEGIRSAIGPTQTVLVFDNCEHVIESCARLTDALLKPIPHLSVLATSREALGIRTERDLSVRVTCV